MRDLARSDPGAVQSRWLSLGRALLKIALGAALVGPAAAAGPDLERERRIGEQIVDAILDGEPVQLRGDDGQAFLAIHTEAANEAAKGTVILLHGRGHHPDWGNVVQPLRVGLTERGWHTLAIQLPVLHNTATYYDYVAIFDHAIPRIEAAIGYARRHADGPVVLLAHSCGAHMAQHWIREKGATAAEQIDAFVGIGMGATDRGQPMRVPFALDRIDAPILDVYADNDFPAVARLAPQRLAAIRRAGHAKSEQRRVSGADHYFVGRGDALLDTVAGWLDTL